MTKLSVYVILTGILLVLTSGIHVTYTLHRMSSVQPIAQFDLMPAYQVQTELIVPPNKKIRPSLYFELAAADSWPHDLGYAYTFTFAGQDLARGSGSINDSVADENTKIETQGAVVKIEERLHPFERKGGDQAILVDIKLDAPGDDTKVLVAQARFDLAPPNFKLSFLGLVLIWTLGILLVLGGTLKWVHGVKTSSAAAPAPASDRTRSWGMLCHLSALLGYIFPFGHVLGPLVIWMLRRDQIPTVEAAGRESLNFQLTVTLMGLIGVMLSAVFIGLILLFLLVVFHFCMTLYASVRVQRGDDFVYPLNIRIINRLDES